MADQMEFRTVVSVLRRRVFIFMLLFLLGASAIVAAAFLMTPVYLAEAKLQLEPRNTTAILSEDGNAPPDSALIDTEISLIQSRDVARAVVKRFELYRDPEFADIEAKNEEASSTNDANEGVSSANDAEVGDGLSAVALDEAETPFIADVDTAEEQPVASVEEAGEQSVAIDGEVEGSAVAVAAADEGASIPTVIDALLENLVVYREGTSYIVVVGTKSNSPEKAQMLANGIVEEYIKFNRNQRSQAAADQAMALSRQLETLAEEVREAERGIARTRAETRTVGGGAGDGSVADMQLSTITAQFAMAQSEAVDARAKAETAREQMQRGEIDAVTAVLQSTAITDLRQRRAVLLGEKARIDERYGALHPEQARISQQLMDIGRELTAEATRIVSGLENDAIAARVRADSLSRLLTQLEDRRAAAAQVEVQIDGLMREVDAKRETYQELSRLAQQRSQEAQLGETTTRVINQAAVPIAPNFPNKPLFSVLGILFGICLGAIGVIIAETLDGAAKTRAHVEKLGSNLLGSLSKVTKSNLRLDNGNAPVWDFVVINPFSVFAETLRNVRNATLTKNGVEVLPKVVTVTSTMPAEGKSTVAASLARVMAFSGDRVLLVDCDVRRNSLRDLLPEPPEAGLLEVLSGKAEIDDVIVVDNAELHLLPLQRPEFMVKDVFGRPEMRLLIEEMRGKYDRIILDAPPVLAVADAKLLSAMSDCTLFVIKWGAIPRKAINTAFERLLSDAGKILGVVYTQVPPSARAYLGLEDPTYYGQRYAQYYVTKK
ncbi:MAG: polysaccharide biosynthesis tyrosine autokinase [Pseudomonadota bacterium]